VSVVETCTVTGFRKQLAARRIRRLIDPQNASSVRCAGDDVDAVS